MTEERAPYGTDELIEFLRFRPPVDPVFRHLYAELSAGRLPLYGADIQVSLLDPFSDLFHPEDHPRGKGTLDLMKARLKAGTRNALWVYPTGERFTVSNDYFALAAIRELEVEVYPCFIMGRPGSGGVIGLKGPLAIARPTRPNAGPNEARFEF